MLLKLLHKLTHSIVEIKKDSKVVKFCLKETLDSIRVLLIS
jgi:hypothetical protein